jgi:photosystem II stability/assembly factor-like uncharacterized protein
MNLAKVNGQVLTGDFNRLFTSDDGSFIATISSGIKGRVISYSLDKGETWKKASNNGVAINENFNEIKISHDGHMILAISSKI